ncbi:methyl-accepting chemotaxis sensory transducer [Janthinobacterium sp. HH01]|uniref:methyl-accepting chemotaxis protein n=1 Tax=Janthinobacterium sp. HH01 TaxID=1198452 RepID=UPI0002AEC156|nr:methyl-accepting chemotaxis protein [Janthinobacterium sp. HH01]ELX13398.1 methyl-accepting chemotaxis sensory transducer [Janthinobacterium sp. HH01]
MFKDLSIKKKLYMSFGAILAIILLLLSIAYSKFTSLAEANGWDRHTMEVIKSIDKMRNDLLQVQVEARGYYLTGDSVRLDNARRELADLPVSLRALQKLTGDNPVQVERFKKLESMIEVWTRDVIESQLLMRKELGDKPGAADAMGHSPQQVGGNAAARSIYKSMDDATAEEQKLLTERSAASNKLQETMRLVLAGGGLACVVLSAVIAWLLVRALAAPLNNLTHAVGRIAAGEQSARAAVLSGDELGQVTTEFNRMAQSIQDSQANELAATNLLKSKVDSLLGVVSRAAAGDLTGKIEVAGSDAIGQLAHGLDRMFENLRALLNNVQKAGIQVTTSATEIAASAKQQEATGIEQAQTSVEILSTTKEISANTSQLLKTMEDATAVADYTTNATADAQNNLRRMDSTMQHMVSATDSINAKLAALSEKASNINSVLITITKVADQTNILSLNAAIEAEKAGEAGRGFSVVATEIRRLADQTSVSTWDIEQMLKEMQSAVSASVMGMDKFSEEIRRSVGEVRQVTDQLSGVMDQVQKLAPQFDAVLQGMQSQAVGAQQISETMMQLNDATQQTVESLKATSEAVHQLQYAAGDLQSSVANFAVAA